MKRIALALAAAALVAQPVAAQDGPRVAHQPSSRFSAAIQVGNTYWLSGKLGVTQETRAMTEGRVAAETHNIMQAFEELLGELGMDFHDTVQATVYLADVDGYSEMNEAYAQYFEGGAPPARVTVVTGLVAGATIEIAFVAVKTDD